MVDYLRLLKMVVITFQNLEILTIFSVNICWTLYICQHNDIKFQYMLKCNMAHEMTVIYNKDTVYRLKQTN